jgi:phosphatidyl-myo-inositol dimannoside synthase
MELVFTGEFPPIKGGIGNFLWSRCQSRPRDGLRILAAECEMDDIWDSTSGFDIQRFHYKHTNTLASLHRAKQLLWAWRALSKELHERSYHLITTNVPLPFGWIATNMKKRGHKVAIFCHGLDIMRPMLSPARIMYRSAMSNCDLYVANSSITAQRLEEQGWDSRRIAVINPPIDPSRFNPSVDGDWTRQTWLRGSEGPIILTVSRLQEDTKGIDTMIKLLPRIKARFPEVKYVIIGDGPRKPFYESLAMENKVRENILFVGQISDEDLPSCYAACDVFVLLSRRDLRLGFYEGFGIVYREAMACGKPVVASSEAGIRDIICSGENGFLVDPRDSDQALNAIIEILTHPFMAATIGNAAVEAAAKGPDWSRLNEMR